MTDLPSSGQVGTHGYSYVTSGWAHETGRRAPAKERAAALGPTRLWRGRPVKSIVAGQRAADPEEFAELALGVDEELFAGVPGESALDRAARMDVAAAVLADLWREAPELAAYAQRLLDTAPRPLFVGSVRTGKGWTAPLGVAA